jgi:hypothetical protein
MMTAVASSTLRGKSDRFMLASDKICFHNLIITMYSANRS